MKISQVFIRGYRCIADLTMDFDDLTALVGSGGVGKSAFLRAIKWFFEGGKLDEDDLHRPAGEGEEPVDEVLVAVTFSDLNDADRDSLGRYAAGDSTTLTRSWRPDEDDKLSGTALVFPGFDYVREGEGATEEKARYKALYGERGKKLGLPEPPGRIDDQRKEMERWERENPSLCEGRTEIASHLRGYVGTPILNDRFAYVFVEATTEASHVVGDSRGSPLAQLLSAIEELDEETEERITSLQSDAQQEMERLISGARAEDLSRIAVGITARVQDYVPGAEVELNDVVAPLRRPDVSVLAQVRHHGGHATDVDRQGHGLQRALVIAVLHELAESSALAKQEEAGGETTPRSLMLAIEEPELYQHPLQARALAATLRELARPASEQAGARSVQVSYSTHSAYFVRPALFEDLRLCRRGSAGQTTSVAADKDEVADILQRGGFTGELKGKVEQTLAQTLAEAVFARAVVLCEGPTDAAVLEAVAARDGGFDREGVAVVRCHGKSLIPIALSILRQLSIPTYVLFDADAGKRARLDRQVESGKKGPEDAKAELESAAKKNSLLLTLCGESGEDWPAEAVRGGCANFADDLEAFLEESWPELVERREAVGRELGMKGKAELAYRQAVLDADSVPEFFTDLLGRVRALL